MDELSSGSGTAGGLLGGVGFDDKLDDLKPAAVSVMQANPAKRPKLTHATFFDDEKGLATLWKEFPRIRFQGKGNEFDDLRLLLRHYTKWFQQLYPTGEHFEDLVWKARSVLQEKDKADDGVISDPKERLHMVRFQYKSGGGVGSLNATPRPGSTGGGAAPLSEEARKRIEANRLRALERKRKSDGPADEELPEEMDMEALWREEEERQRTMERKQPSNAPAAFDDEEDVFGFGFDFDGTGGSLPPQRPAARAPAPPGQDEEEDVFGFGFGFDDDATGGAPAKAAPQPPARQLPDEEEDPFGHGHGFDDDEAMGAPAPPAQAVPAPTPAPAPAPVAVDGDAKARIEENRKRALEKKRQAEAVKEKARLDAEAAEKAAAAQPASAFDEPPDEDDIFGFGGGPDYE